MAKKRPKSRPAKRRSLDELEVVSRQQELEQHDNLTSWAMNSEPRTPTPGAKHRYVVVKRTVSSSGEFLPVKRQYGQYDNISAANDELRNIYERLRGVTPRNAWSEGRNLDGRHWYQCGDVGNGERYELYVAIIWISGSVAIVASARTTSLQDAEKRATKKAFEAIKAVSKDPAAFRQLRQTILAQNDGLRHIVTAMVDNVSLDNLWSLLMANPESGTELVRQIIQFDEKAIRRFVLEKEAGLEEVVSQLLDRDLEMTWCVMFLDIIDDLSENMSLLIDLDTVTVLDAVIQDDWALKELIWQLIAFLRTARRFRQACTGTDKGNVMLMDSLVRDVLDKPDARAHFESAILRGQFGVKEVVRRLLKNRSFADQLVQSICESATGRRELVSQLLAQDDGRAALSERMLQTDEIMQAAKAKYVADHEAELRAEIKQEMAERLEDELCTEIRMELRVAEGAVSVPTKARRVTEASNVVKKARPRRKAASKPGVASKTDANASRTRRQTAH